MGAIEMVGTWLRWSWRRRWRGLVGVALLVALSAGVVMATAAGSVRASSALERLTAETDAATLNILPNVPGFDWEAVRALPQVDALSVYWVSATMVIDDDRALANTFFVPLDSDDIERPVALEGRLADPTRVDEVVVTPAWARAHGRGVGDTVTIALYEPASVGSASLEFFRTGAVPAPDGPVIEAEVVGIARSFWTALTENAYAAYFPDGVVFPSRALFDRYLPNLIGDGESAASAYANAIVRLHDGAAGVPAFTRAFGELVGRDDIDIWGFPQQRAAVQGSIGFEAGALLALAAAAGVASIILVGQAVARMAGADAAELGALVGAGLSPALRVCAAVAPSIVASGVGVILGAAGAITASVLFPLGTAALYEPAPGLAVDLPVLGAIGAASMVVVAAIAAISAGVVVRARRRPRPASPVTAAAARFGIPVPAVVGVRFALERGVGSQAVPVLPTVVAVVAGVMGLVGTLTFAHGLDDATTVQPRWGQSWQLVAALGANGAVQAEAASVTAAYETVPAVRATAETRNAVAASGDAKIAVWSFDDAIGDELVILEGRRASGPGEVLLGPTTLADLRLSVGERITLDGSRGRATVTIVGTALTPEGSHSAYDDSGWIDTAGYAALFGDDFKQSGMLVWLHPGTDVGEAITALTEASATLPSGAVPPWEPTVPGKVAALERVGLLPQVLGVFLVVLAVGAVAHALLAAISRRAKDIAVLRALGMTPGGARGITFTQAAVIGAIGIVAGVPLGWALGRTVWRFVARSTPVAFAEPMSAVVLAITVPATIGIALLIAIPAGRRAARLQVAATLRTE